MQATAIRPNIETQTINSKTSRDIVAKLEEYLEENHRENLARKVSDSFRVFKTQDSCQMDLEHFNRLFNDIDHTINEPDLGIRLSTKHAWIKEDFTEVTQKLFRSNNLEVKNFEGLYPSVAASFLIHYFPISTGLFEIKFVLFRDSCKFIIKPSTSSINLQLVEAMIFGLHRYFVTLSKERITRLKLCQNSSIRHYQPHQDAYGVKPEFSEKREYELEYTNRGNPRSFNQIHLNWIMLLEKIYENNLPDSSFSNRVRGMIQALLPLQMADRETIAQIYNLSISSLQRKLKIEGYTFSDLVLEERIKMSEYYIKESDILLTEVSDLLGYQEISHFSKAFKRWFGSSPSKYFG